MTQAVIEAARWFEIVLYDHIVIGRGGHVSMKEAGGLGFEKSV
jgi:DNA repair protein RadC